MTPGWKGSRSHFFTFAALVVLASAFLSSCLKQSTVETGPRKMIVAFNSGTIPYESVDSAAAIFTKQGSQTPYYLRFEKRNGTFELSMEDFTTGIWTFEALMNTKKDTAGKSFQYTASATMDVAQISGVLLGAPDRTTSTVWKKSIVLSASNNEVVSFTPLDLTNPEFTLIANNPKWDSFYVRKVAYQTVGTDSTVVMTKTWACANCLGSDGYLRDTTYFNDFSQYIKTRSWNAGFVEVRFKDTETSDEKSFNHHWNKQ